jgi:hypothetical protein
LGFDAEVGAGFLRVTQSSGVASLDAEGLARIARAAPFSPLPDEWHVTQLALAAPHKFSLHDRGQPGARIDGRNEPPLCSSQLARHDIIATPRRRVEECVLAPMAVAQGPRFAIAKAL